MELYTRIIDEGIFIFWDEQNFNSYELSVYIHNNGKKIRLVNSKVEHGVSYYSLNHIGSGNYEIELNVYNGGKLIETVTKKVMLASNSQRVTELLDKLDDIKDAINSFDTSAIDVIAHALREPGRVVDMYNWAQFLLKLEREKENRRKW